MLNRDDLELIDRLSSEAAGLPLAERADRVRRGSGGRPEVEREVLELLRLADSLPEGFLSGHIDLPGRAAGAGQPGATDAPTDLTPSYQIRGVLGAGGFGVVYRAEQRTPLRRTVAVKVLRSGPGGPEALARFESERRTLAMMRHPGIAQVYDAGSTGDGMPFVVMELIDGPPITAYCDGKRLTVRQRVALIADVADALQHAHTKLVVHRDLKPGNILVAEEDGVARVKLIDFGIAKLLVAADAEQPGPTRTGQIVGTLDYLSPEQLETTPPGIDTRADVYALGVVLQELVSATRPFSGPSVAAQRAAILGAEPARPSAALRLLRERDQARADSIAAARASEPAALERELRRELDWIVSKCLAREPAKRYQTADALGADLRRYLARQPVVARPPSALYRARALVRRSPGLAAASAAAIAFLLLGSAGVAAFAVREQDAREHAMEEAAVATAFSDMLLNDVIGAADPMSRPDPDITVREALRRTAAALPARFPDDPLVRARVHMAIADALRGLSDYQGSLEQCLAALDIRREIRGELHEATLQSLNDAALNLRSLGRPLEAIEPLEQTLEGYRALHGPSHEHTVRAMSNLATTYQSVNRYAEAAALLRAVIRIREQELGAGEQELAIPLNNLGAVLINLGDYDGAIACLHRSAAARETAYGPSDQRTLTALGNLAQAMDKAGRAEEALPLHQRVYDGRRDALDPDHSARLSAANRLGHCLAKLGRLEDAEALFADVFDRQRTLLEPGHSARTMAASNVAMVWIRMERCEEAAGLLDAALGETMDAGEQGTLMHGVLLQFRADARACQGLVERAAQDYSDALAVLLPLLGPGHERVLRVQERIDELRVTLMVDP
ncbi:MAG: serine/threonine protein kinase [Phycisphaerales bacterium]|nr:serine/threonine protein kinase [Phycisphaerales bacterium]